MTYEELQEQIRRQAQIRRLSVYAVGKRLCPQAYRVQWSDDGTKLHLTMGGKVVVIGDPKTKFCYAV